MDGLRFYKMGWWAKTSSLKCDYQESALKLDPLQAQIPKHDSPSGNVTAMEYLIDSRACLLHKTHSILRNGETHSH